MGNNASFPAQEFRKMTYQEDEIAEDDLLGTVKSRKWTYRGLTNSGL
jgi:hypothetical protein